MQENPASVGKRLSLNAVISKPAEKLTPAIMECGSTSCVGMAGKKMAAACTLYKLLYSELCSRCSHKAFMIHTSHSWVFSSATRSLVLLETIAGVPHRQVAKRPNRLSSFILSFSQASTIMAEAITMTQTRKSTISTGILHSYHGIFKEIKLFNSVHEHSRLDACHFHTIL